MKKEEKIISGIYCFENIINNKKYIGKSKDINSRILNHLKSLRKNKHDNQFFQNAWNKYGEKNFKTYVIEKCAEKKLNDKEKYYISLYNTRNQNYGYNLTSGGDGGDTFLGGHHTEETIEKMKKNRPDQTGDKNPMFGKHHSDEVKERIKKSNEGKHSGILAGKFGKRKSKNISSKYKGISRIVSYEYGGKERERVGKRGNKYIRWVWEVTFNKKRYRSKKYKKEKDAALDRDAFIIENKLPHPLNFPKRKRSSK